MARLTKLLPKRPRKPGSAEWEEREHPRAAGGRFGDKPDEPATTARRRRAEAEVAAGIKRSKELEARYGDLSISGMERRSGNTMPAPPPKGRFTVKPSPKAKPAAAAIAAAAPQPDGAHSDLKGYLTMVAGFRQGQPSVEQFLLDTGQDFPFDSGSFKGGPQHQCYKNASQYVLENPDATYVEGFVSVHGVPIAHAWAVDKDGMVIDPTIGEGGRGIQGYYGTPIQQQFLMERLVDSRVYGLLQGKPTDVLKTIQADPKKAVAPIKAPTRTVVKGGASPDSDARPAPPAATPPRKAKPTPDEMRGRLAAISADKSAAESLSEEERVDLLVAGMENPQLFDPPSYNRNEPDSPALIKAREESSAALHGNMLLSAMPVRSREQQYRVADAFLQNYGRQTSVQKQYGSPVETMLMQHADAEVLDYIGSKLPAGYTRDLAMFSPDYKKFRPAFIANWTKRDRSRAFYAVGAVATDTDGNQGKQLYAGETVGIPGQPRQPVPPSWLQQSKNVAANVKKLYAETQAFYAGKEPALTVKRGLGLSEAGGYNPWAAESWTVDANTADRFGKMFSRDGETFSVLTAEVPTSGILMSYEAQADIWPEAELQGKKEIVVLGGSLTNMRAKQRRVRQRR